MFQDLRYALRLVWRTPILSGIAAVALALGIGATTAMFSVVSGVLLRPLPYRAPEALVTIRTGQSGRPDDGQSSYTLTGAEAAALREMTDVFEDVAILELWTTSWEPRYALTGRDQGERLRGALVDPNFFELLGVIPAMGRTLSATTQDPDAVVISHALWRRQFGMSPDAIGQVLVLDGQPRPIAGVLPRHVRVTYPEETDVYLGRPQALHEYAVSYEAVGRLKAGVSPEAATAALARLTGQGHRAIRQRLEARRLQQRLTGDVSYGLWLVTSAAGVLCLTAALNAALLLLTRTVRRLRALEIRLVLGARRRHLLRQVLTENGVVGVLGVAAGLAVAHVVHPAAVALAPHGIPRLDETSVDRWSLLCAVSIGCICAMLSTLIGYGVACRSEGRIAGGQLGTHATSGTRSVVWRRALLGSQAAFLVTSLSVAAILLQSFINVWQIDLGFVPSGVTVMQLTSVRVQLPATATASDSTVAKARSERAVASARLSRTVAELRTALGDTAGIDSVALTYGVPLEISAGFTWVPQSRDNHLGDTPRISVIFKGVTDGFFDVLGIPLVEGRAISKDDVEGQRRVMVVSAGLARHFFPGQSAVGRTIRWDEPYEVVGVARDVRWERPEEPGMPAFYVPLDAAHLSLVQVIVRSALPAAQVHALTRGVLQRLDRQQPIDRVTTLEAIVAGTLAERRFYAGATGAFGLLGLALAAVGIFGAVAASIEERRRDIGIRLALGASRAQVQWGAMQHSLVPIAAGLIVGATTAAYAVRLVGRFLYQVRPLEPRPLVMVFVIIVSVALLTAWVPARRAARVAPATVLREE